MLTDYHKRRIEHREQRIETLRAEVIDLLHYIKNGMRRYGKLKPEVKDVFEGEALLMQIKLARQEVSEIRKQIKRLEKEIDREYRVAKESAVSGR